jgi:long-chain fatty acid transport protein
MGLNVAFHVRPSDWLKIGLSYRSQVSQNVNGDALYSRTPLFNQLVNAKALPANSFQNTNAYGSVTLPDELFFGAAFYPTKDFSIEAGLIYTRWSTYKDLTFNFGTAPVPGTSTTSSSRKDWNDVIRPFIGAEYKTTDWLDLRLGFAWDQEAINPSYVDYALPANNRYWFTLGPGFHWQNWTLDLSYTYIYVVNRDNIQARPADNILPSSFSNGHTNMIGCSLSYKF